MNSAIAPDTDQVPPLIARIARLRQEAVSDTNAAMTLADLLSLHPFLAATGELRNCYQRGAQAGIVEANAALAQLALLDSGRETDAWSIWASVAQQGFAHGLLQAGYCLRWGIGTSPNPEAGLTQYLRAAAQGSTVAFALLSELYRTGDGAPLSTEVAAAWQHLAELRRFPRRPPAPGEQADELASALKQNIQALGSRIANLGISSADPEYCDVFSRQVAEHFETLGRPEVSISEQTRPPAARPPPLSTPNIQFTARQPRLIQARQFATTEDCIHLLSGCADSGVQDQATGSEIPISLSLMTPAAHKLIHDLGNLLHLPWQYFEPPVLTPLENAFENQEWRLTQPQRLAKSRIGDNSGKRMVTAWLALATPTEGVHFSVTGAGNSSRPHRALKAGDLLCTYHLDPDGAPADAAVTQLRSDGDAWLLRLHACERAPWPLEVFS